MAPKHMGSDAGTTAKRSCKVLSLREKVNILDLVRKKKMFAAVETSMVIMNLPSMKL